MWYQESVTFSVGATRMLSPSSCAELRGARRQRARDEAVGVERHVRAVLLGRPDRDQHRVDALLDPLVDLRPRHPLDEVLGHHRDLHRMSDIVQYSPVVEGQAEVNGVKLWYDVSR